ncbi:MAG: histidine phosphatase family protein [Candidatus Brocadiales bacterium]|nr:histidine phosphatase family protein [Candidatus Brocadiales bacterium]
MSSVLETVEWGKSAIQFLNTSFKLINNEKPAIVYLRHSQADYTNVESPKDGVLTELGIQTSKEFGSKLPSDFRYRIYHSKYPRAKITADQILQGLTDQNVESHIVGVQEGLIFVNRHDATIKKFFDIYGSNFIAHWMSGRFDEHEIGSSLDLAKDSSKRVVRNLKDAEPGSIDLYVNHDITIIPMMFHWFGVYKKYRWVGNLDGFILQLYEDTMIYIDKEGEHKVGYPYWWNFSS